MKAAKGWDSGRITEHNTVELHISMPPLSQAKVEVEKEQLLGDDRHFIVDKDAEVSKIPGTNLHELKDRTEEKELDNILRGKPAADKIDKAFMNNMLSRLQSGHLKAWTVNQVSLASPSNVRRLCLYQPALRTMMLEQTLLPQRGSDVQTMTQQLGETVTQVLQGEAPAGSHDSQGPHSRENLARIKACLNFSKAILSKEEESLEFLEQQRDERMESEEDELAELVRQEFVDIWRGITELAEAKHKDMNFPQKDARWPWEEPTDLNLFASRNRELTDQKLATILARSLERKFFTDLGLSHGTRTDREILEAIERWATETMLKAPTEHGMTHSQRTDAFFDESRGCFPYATLFCLLMTGQHKIAVRYAQEFACPRFTELYQDYYEKYKCKGLPKNQIKRHFQAALDTTKEGGIADEYKALIVHILVGSKYRDGPEFMQAYLFGDENVELWYLLRLASYRYADE